MSAHGIDKVEGTEVSPVMTGAFSDLGAHRKGAYVFFGVYAPQADSVCLVGSFNDWKDIHPMQKSGDGVWRIALDQSTVSDGDSYKYMVYRGGKASYVADPYMTETDGGPYFNSVYRDVPDETVLTYDKERHVGCFDVPINIYSVSADRWFCDKKGYAPDYASLAREMLPYVLQMGYTHVNLSRVTELCCDLRTGESERACFAPRMGQGGAHALRTFVSTMHSADIGVIMELDLYKTFGNTEADIAFYTENALYWLDRFGVDGICIDRTSGRGEEFFSRLVHSIKQKRKEVYTVSACSDGEHVYDADIRPSEPKVNIKSLKNTKTENDRIYARSASMAVALLGSGKMMTKMGEELAQKDNVGISFDRSLQEIEINSGFQLFCAELNHLYLSNPPFWKDDRTRSELSGGGDMGLTVITREYADDELIFAADTVGKGGEYITDSAEWHMIFDSCRPLGRSESAIFQCVGEKNILRLPPFGAAVLKRKK